MPTDDVTDGLRSIGLRTSKEALRALLDHATRSRLAPAETCEHLIALERRERDARNLAARTKAATLGKVKPLDRFDWSHPRKIRPTSLRGASWPRLRRTRGERPVSWPQRGGQNDAGPEPRPRRPAEGLHRPFHDARQRLGRPHEAGIAPRTGATPASLLHAFVAPH